MNEKLLAITLSVVLFWLWVAILFLASVAIHEMLIAFAIGTALSPISYAVWVETYKLFKEVKK